MSDSYAAWCEEQDAIAYKRKKEKQDAIRNSLKKGTIILKLKSYLNNVKKQCLEASENYNDNNFGLMLSNINKIDYLTMQISDKLGIDLND